jgi:hypothetical protein
MRQVAILSLLVVLLCAGFSCSTSSAPPGFKFPGTVTDDNGHTFTDRTLTFTGSG